MQGGVVSHLRNDVEVSCLPKDLPEFLEVDLSGMDMNETKYLSDISCRQAWRSPSSRMAVTSRSSRSTRRVPRSRSRLLPSCAAAAGEGAAAAAAGAAARRAPGAAPPAAAATAKKGEEQEGRGPAKKEGGKK